MAGFGGLTLPGLLAARDGGNAKQAKSVILLRMAGGPSQIDTLDPNQVACLRIGIRSASRRPNCPVSSVHEHLPKLAAMLDRFTIIRSVNCRQQSRAEYGDDGEPARRIPACENPEARNYPAIGSLYNSTGRTTQATPCSRPRVPASRVRRLHR
ncbi:MAG: DUF1501 domain-containing protein [Gemmataceae bacterium]